jgi:glycerol kinase
VTILAIDQGTTSTRAFLADDRGMRLLAAFPHRQSYPAPGRVEHDPEELLANLRACLAAAGGAGVTAVGLANQGESCLAWDARTGAPLSPVIVWQDDRTRESCAALCGTDAERLLRDRAGLPPDPYFAGSKLGWLLREDAAVRAAAREGRLRLGTTDAFFRDRLTGSFATDATTASRTALMNLRTLTWDSALCALFGVPEDTLPPITPSTGALGAVGIGGRAVPLTASLVDQQAALFGHGCRRPGDAKITFGTGAFALALTGPLVPDAPGVLPTVAWAMAGAAPVYALDGGVATAAAALNWARDLGLFRDWDAIADFAAPPAIARGLAFVPALAGLAAPHWDRAARGSWLGLDLGTTPDDMVQAVLEGIAFRTAEALSAMGAAVTLNDPVSVDGGMTRNRWFCRFLADVLGRPVRISAEAELTALGLAELAAAGAGLPLALPRGGNILDPRPIPPAWRARFAAACAAVRSYGAAG